MSHRQRQARRRRNRGSRSPALIALLALLSVGAAAGLSVVGYVVATAASGPDIDQLQPMDKGTSSAIFAADGSRLGYVQSDEIREPIPQRDMPRHLREATVAIEDERFFSHEGVDYEAIVRAGVKNVRSRRTVEGGSTITQQLVRALYIKDAERNLERKIREAKLASELEERRSKAWILREYLNSVPYGTVNGRTAIGVEAAAFTLFAKRAKELTLEESALIAGLPQAPSQYNPFRNLPAAIARRNAVLSQMAENGYISRERAQRGYRVEPKLRRGNRYVKRREPYFFDFVQEQLIEEYGAGVFRRGGLKIRTTIDPKLQEAGRKAIEGQLNLPDDPSSAVVSIEPRTGYIRAMASSGTYGDRRFNLAAQGHRQPGSAFKTMVLTTALRRGVNPQATTYTSKPLELRIPGFEPFKVKTYDDKYGGQMDLVRATLRSDNSVYAQLDADLGPKKVAETAKLMGITTKLDGFPAEGLGGLRIGVSPLEMANAYATLASGGLRAKPKAITRVEFPDGKVDTVSKPERKRVLSDGVAYEVTKILEQNVQAGTGTKANIGCPAAGKTGTTDKFNDAWFVGYTPSLSTSVWVGYPNAQRAMESVHGIRVAGGTFPAQIWHDFMNVAKRKRCNEFATPTQPVTFAPFSPTVSRKASSTPEGGPFDAYGAPTAPVAPAPTGAPAAAATPAKREERSSGGGGGGGGGDSPAKETARPSAPKGGQPGAKPPSAGEPPSGGGTSAGR
jgi:penicillin-binding protein 1A